MDKYIYSEPFNNTRELVYFVNEHEIPKEDIVTVLNLHGQLMLIYYK